MPLVASDLRSRFESVWRRSERVRARRDWRTDVALALVLAAVAGLVGGLAVSRAGQGSFYQGEFSPAVVRACGSGYTGLQPQEGDALNRFLTLESQQLDCADLEGVPRLDLNPFGSAHRYLLESAAVLWKIRGISWEALVPLFAALFALTALGLYGLFRLVAGRVLATLGTLVLIFSPEQTDMLRNLRDYAKAPFLICAFFLIALFATKRLTPRRALLVGAATGLVVGIGFGFRADVLIAVPLFVGTVCFFWKGGLRCDVLVRVGVLAAFAVTFAVSALPIFLSYASGGNLTLMGIHGSTNYFDPVLGVEQDLYDIGYLYNDPYAVSLVNAHDVLVDGHDRYLELGQSALDDAAGSMYSGVTRNLPADFFVRSEAAILRVLDMAPGALGRPVASQVDPLGLGSDARRILRSLLSPLGKGWVLVAVALLVGAARDVRLALGAFLAVGFLGAVNAFQASARHWFYLEFVWWVAVAFLAHSLALALVWEWRRRHAARAINMSREHAIAIGTRIAVLGAVALLTLVVPLAAARACQAGHVETILERYRDAPKTRLGRLTSPAGPGTTLVRIPDDSPAWHGTTSFRAAFLVLRFVRDGCTYPQVRAVARYKSSTAYEDWSTPLDVRLGKNGSGVELYFLGFHRPTTKLVGFELPTDELRCLREIQFVADTSGLPLLLNATLAPDWQDATPYQTFTWEDRRGVYDDAPYVTSSSERFPSYDELALADVIPAATANWRERGVEALGTSGWSYRQASTSKFGYLSVGDPVRLHEGESLVVHGKVEHGGLTVGLQKENAWVTTTSALQRGEFWAIVEAGAEASYALVIANQLQNDGDRQDVVVEDVRILPAG